MSEAEKYVAGLQRQFPRERSFAQAFQTFLNVPGPLIGRAISVGKNYIFGDSHEESLYNLIKPGLSLELQKLVDNKSVLLTKIHDPSPGAYVKYFPNQEYVIVYNQGLVNFIYRVCRAFVAHFVSIEGVDASNDPVNGARIIAEIFWWYEKAEAAYGPSYQISKQKILIANRLATWAEAFFLAHEFGHIFISEEAQLDIDVRAEETSADIFAIATIQLALSGKPQSGLEWIGVELGLLIFAALEELGIDFGTRHPPFAERLEIFRSEIGKRLPADGSAESVKRYAMQCDRIFREIIRITEYPEAVEREFYSEQELAVAKSFRSLVDQCADYPRGNPSALTADHMTFRHEIPKLINFGFSYVIFREVFEMALSMKRLNDQFLTDPDNPKVAAEFALAFNRFRVLALWIGDSQEPLNSLFSQALSSGAKGAGA